MSTQDTQQPAIDSVALLFAGAATANKFTIMETIRAKFMKTSRDAQLANAMQQLIANAVQREDTDLPPSFENRGRGSGLVLVGPTGVGKSKSLERYFNNHPVLNGYADPASGSPLVSVAVPSPCTSMQLARALLRATGYVIERDMAAHRLWEKALDRLQAMRKFIVHFDEIQHVVHNMPERDLQQMADTLKNAMYNRRITLILSGVSTLVPFIQFDAQLFRRLAILPFDSNTPDKHDDIRKVLGTYAKAAGLSEFRASKLDNADFIARLSHAALNAYGYTVVLTQLAIENALEKGSDRLTDENFATVFAQKTSFSADRNPFLAPNWHMIDCSKMFEKVLEAPPAAISRKRKAKS